MIALTKLTALATPYAWDADDPGEPLPEPTETFLSALRTYTLALPALEGLADVYLSQAPPEAVFPYLILNRLYSNAITNSTDSWYKETGIQFTLFSQDDVEATALADAAFEAMLPSSSSDPVRFTDGYEMGRVPGSLHGPDSQNWGMPAGDPVWRVYWDYVFFVGKEA